MHVFIFEWCITYTHTHTHTHTQEFSQQAEPLLLATKLLVR